MTPMRLLLLSLLLGLLPAAVRAQAPIAPDPTGCARSGAEVQSDGYRFPAKRETLVWAKGPTELWGRIWAPRPLPEGPLPLVLLVPGEHPGCGRPDGRGGYTDLDYEYAQTGRCTRGRVVIPSHEGFAWAGEALARCGMIAVAIHTDRGASSFVEGLEPALQIRSRLILRHLQLLAGWSRQGGQPQGLTPQLRGRLDLDRVGLGGIGEGAEASINAAAILRKGTDALAQRVGPLRIRGVLSLAPTDILSDPTGLKAALVVEGAHHAIVFPRCGENPSALAPRLYARGLDLGSGGSGPRPLLAMMGLGGAHERGFNSLWRVDTPGRCLGTPDLDPGRRRARRQEAASLYPLLALFRGSLQAERWLALFDPSADLPEPLVRLTRVTRLARPSRPDVVLDRLGGTAGYGSHGRPIQALGVSFRQDRLTQWSAPVLRFGWGPLSATARLVLPVAPQGEAAPPPEGVTSLAFRILQACGGRGSDECTILSALNPMGQELDLGVTLIGPGGERSSTARIARQIALLGPEGRIGDYQDPTFLGFLNSLPQTVRIPLTAFGRVPAGGVDRIEISSLGQASGEVMLMGPISWSREPGNAPPQPGPPWRGP